MYRVVCTSALAHTTAGPASLCLPTLRPISGSAELARLKHPFPTKNWKVSKQTKKLKLKAGRFQYPDGGDAHGVISAAPALYTAPRA